MQKSIVTFNDPDNNRTITVNFSHDTDSQTLDYQVNAEPEMVEGEDYGLNLFLANMFLESLQKAAPKKPRKRKKKIEDGSETKTED